MMRANFDRLPLVASTQAVSGSALAIHVSEEWLKQNLPVTPKTLLKRQSNLILSNPGTEPPKYGQVT